MQAYADAASRAVTSHKKPEQKEPPPLAPQLSPQLSQLPSGKSRAQSVVLHGVPTHRRIGKMWGWLQEDNESASITSVRWLVMDEARRGKTRWFLVVHLNSCETVALLRMGRQVYPRDQYASSAMTAGKGGRRRHSSSREAMLG